MRSVIFTAAVTVVLLAVAAGCDDKPKAGPPYTGPLTPVRDDQKPPALPPAPK